MRLALIPPAELSPERRPLYDDMKRGIESGFQGFKAIGNDGALIGPWNPWLKFAKFGGPVWELVKASPYARLRSSSPARASMRGYEIYAHVLVAELRGLSDEKISTIVAGQRPADLTREESVAYDVASALNRGGV